jgi:hypothetical protein
VTPLSNCPRNARALVVMVEWAVKVKNSSMTVRCGEGRSGGAAGFGGSVVEGWQRLRRGFLPALGFGS